MSLSTLALYWPVSRFQFINYDDPLYVTENEHVKSGLSWEGAAWAFRAVVSSNWHPMTLLSHMLDCQVYGLNPAGPHLTNLLFHLANTLLLFLILKQMTGALWRSGLVAGLFAMHPLHVESVAWISERKDVLSTFFFLLTLWAYARYCEESKIQSPKSKVLYCVALSFFVLGLMSKPMLVTLPFILLLLDYWPLKRFELSILISQPSTFCRFVWEKLPFFLLAALSCGSTLWAQHVGGSLIPVEAFPFGSRVANAVLSYWRYVQKTLWPSHLAVFYPHGDARSTWLVLSAGMALVVVTGAAIRTIKRPCMAVGWLWFVGTLVPVIGLVQVGQQAMADRYTYIPSIGLFIVAAFGLNEVAARFRCGRIVAGTFVGLLLAGCFVATSSQVLYWRDSETLYRHAINVTEGNYVAYNNLGTVLEGQGKLDQAMSCYAEALRFRPDYAYSHSNLGQALMNEGRLDEAEVHLQQALQSSPKSSRAYYNLASLLYRQGKIEDAIAAYRRAIALNENLPDAHTALGCLLAAQGKPDEAIAHFQRALHYRPDFPDALNNLGAMLIEQGRAAEAVTSLTKAIQLKPAYAEAHYNLGNAYLALEQPREAYAAYQMTLRLKPGHDWAHYRMGNLFLAEGNREAAAAQYRAALTTNPNHAEAHFQLAALFVARQRVADGIQHYREALRLKPKWVEPLNNLAWLLATHPDLQYRDGPEAVRLATHAVELTNRKDAEALDTLAAAYAETGHFSNAVTMTTQALELALSSGQENLAAQIQSRLQLYQSGKPYHEP